MKNLIYLFLSFCMILLALGACGGNSPTGSNPRPDPDPDPEPTTGAVEVTITTGGSDIDEDGYTITVDGANGVSSGSSDTITITDLEEGSHDLELTGAADNCAVDGDNPLSITITAGETASTEFAVTCSTVSTGEPLINQIVFISSREGNFGSIYRMNADGTDQVLIDAPAEDANRGFEMPDISPDGTRIAYVQGGSIWVINVNNPEDRMQLTDSGGDLWPSWSPDGSNIAFTSDRDGNADVFVMNADGTDQTNLTNDYEKNDSRPSWSPDGQRIAFTRSVGDSGVQYDIITMNIGGTDLQNITEDGVDQFFPQYSPDGTKIAFIRRGSGNTDLYTMNTDGGNQQRITSGIFLEINKASWSPDGSQFVFESDRDDSQGDIYVINADGTNLMRLTVNDGIDVDPDWSPVQQ